MPFKSRQREASGLAHSPTPDLIEAVWEKADLCGHGVDGKIYRKDQYGSWIARASYGTEEEFGWEIDGWSSLTPSKLSRLQPLHWKNRRLKADGCLESEIMDSTE